MTLPPLFLERAREDDLDALLDLERRSFTHPWTAQHFREELAPPGTLLVLRGPAPSLAPGRGIAAYSAHRLVGEELSVLNLAVSAPHRRRGLARWLLSFALDTGSRRGARRAFLEVRRSNRAALALYQGLGFQVQSIRRGYYADPGEDALVLVHSLLPRGLPRGLGDDP
ncbi:MAG TPA: ribosomal protein S18-alanine N-acetyltransferase [Vicinamibacteria bacterium]|nr:ribosomal protein S18-alanine N-acetyltransferase [Vicinamibacteria bacterium]